MNNDSPAARRSVYLLLITVSAGVVLGHILSANLVHEPYLHRNDTDTSSNKRIWPKMRPEPMPTFSSNDRSRWCTIRALVEKGTFVIGERPKDVVLLSAATPLAASNAIEAAALQSAGYQARTRSDRGIVFEDGWGTVDKVLHPERLQFYSSKPPLLPTLVAGQYWLLRQTLGWEITDPKERWLVVYSVLLTVNWLPLLVYLWVLSLLVERYGTTSWGRYYVLAAGGLGSFVAPFAVTLNNHSIAVTSVLLALYPALRIWDEHRRPRTETDSESRPAPAWLFLVSGLFAGFTVTNELPAASFGVALFVLLLLRAPARTLAFFLPAALAPIVTQAALDYIARGTPFTAYAGFGGPSYEYEGSHWRVLPGQVKKGIDFAAEHKLVYTFHLLFGHHGVFSLTPFNMLAVIGLGIACIAGIGRLVRPEAPTAGLFPRLHRLSGPTVIAVLTVAVSVAVAVFTIWKTNNYGGWTAGPRWFMWLTPLWLLAMLPVVDWLASRRWGQWLACILLGLSIFAASYPTTNPWRHPLLYQVMEAQGWIDY